MATVGSVCFNCDKREVGCHGRCEKYLGFKREREERNRKIRLTGETPVFFDPYKSYADYEKEKVKK